MSNREFLDDLESLTFAFVYVFSQNKSPWCWWCPLVRTSFPTGGITRVPRGRSSGGSISARTIGNERSSASSGFPAKIRDGFRAVRVSFFSRRRRDQLVSI